MPDNVCRHIANVAIAHPTSVALLAHDRQHATYSDIFDQVDALTGTLSQLECASGTRIAVMLDSGPEMAVACLAIMGTSICVPINPHYPASELLSLLPRLNVTHMLTDRALYATHGELFVSMGLSVIIATPDPTAPAGRFTFEIAHKPGNPVVPSAKGTPQNLALLLHTSGSTGTPKLVPLTHENLLSAMANVVSSLALTPSDRCLNTMPMFHVGGLVDLFLAPLSVGSSIITAPTLGPQSALTSILEFSPTWYQGVPTMLADFLANLPDELPPKVANLRFIRSVSAPLPARLLADIEARLDIPVIEIFGMSETAGLIASTPLPPGMRKPGSVGIAAGPEVAIVDVLGNRIGADVRGEIVVRGPSVISSYLDQNASQSSAFIGSWMRSGDEGYLDADGYLFLTGRLKDIINRGGEKIAPSEIDIIVNELEGVAEAAAYARPHAGLGEEVGLAVVLRPGAPLSEADILHHLSPKLVQFKQPRHVDFLATLPRVPSGKLDRRAIAGLVGISSSQSEQSPPRLPETPLQRQLVEIWQRILQIDEVGLGDDFFDLGGDSLKATTLMIELEAIFDQPLDGALLFDASTIAELSEKLSHLSKDAGVFPANVSPGELPDAVYQEIKRQIAGWQGNRAQSASLITGRNTFGTKIPLFWGVTKEAEFSQLARNLDADQPIYAMRSLSTTQLKSDDNTRLLAHQYAREIVRLCPTDPIQIGGFCDGGRLAFFAAQWLKKQGRQVDLLLHDRFVPEPYDGPVTFFWGITGWLFSHEVERANKAWRRYYSGPLSVVELPVEHQMAYEDSFAPQLGRAISDELARLGGRSEPESTTFQPLEVPLPSDIYQARLSARVLPLLRQGRPHIVRTKVRNTSAHDWMPTEQSGICLAARWTNLDGFEIVQIEGFTALKQAVPSGGEVHLELEVVPPARGLPMFLVIDLLEEGVGWFGPRGSRPAKSLVMPLGRRAEAKKVYSARRR
ncbi:AMP-binding protein [Devosia rhodophyticola]|uniref:AMP-binding protein n=1 Tax=Devosia rhodophyticola TaxID=3026423 RepID=A0ABY7Z0D0_9HYPH|nr:AMP-binding protein [Devosia rhodophyticola]WDR07098.1 AMP-binding protein [Devosia rhodophyticola]